MLDGDPMTRRLASVAAVLAALAAAASANASRAPTAAERAVIVRTVKSSALTAMVDDANFDVRRIRISTVPTPGLRYAAVKLVPRPGVQADGADGALRRKRGHWRLINLGTSSVGCILPRSVRRDLKLGCP
ncbi:MAG: hypothetical protein QOJ35_305 [Solirubrobacteraceae bacterium]|jgi:hypothetical protein|nr:hypothetical protein [Solirubrobacteraceae bacterium]